MRYSIIIPVYNCEKYISSALESVISQNEDSKEVIIINDGSTDNSQEICQEYQNKYSFIHVINKDNSGVSETRNLGLEKASGDYIIFLDADDELCSNALETFNSIIEKEDKPNIILSNFCSKINGDIKKSKDMCDAVIEKTDNEFENCILEFYRKKDNNYGNLRTIWAKAFSAELLKNIRFNKKLRIGEDMLFFLEAAINSKKIAVTNECTYIYRINEQSVMQTKKWEKAHSNLLYYTCVKDLIKSKNIENDLFSLWLEIYENEWMDLIKSDNSFSVKYKIFKEYCQDSVFKQYVNTTRSLSKIEKIYILSIKHRLVMLWISLLKIKIYKNS